jgi:hypothetical protein
LIPRNNPQKKQAAFGIHVNPDTPLDSPSLKTENPAHSDIGNQITRSTRFSPFIEENPAINIKKGLFLAGVSTSVTVDTRLCATFLHFFGNKSPGRRL